MAHSLMRKIERTCTSAVINDVIPCASRRTYKVLALGNFNAALPVWRPTCAISGFRTVSCHRTQTGTVYGTVDYALLPVPNSVRSGR